MLTILRPNQDAEGRERSKAAVATRARAPRARWQLLRGGVEVTYRQGPTHAPLARVEGSDLEVPSGGRLPRVCTSCGGTRKLREDEHLVEWRPAGGVVLVLFGLVGRVLSDNLRRTARLTYSTCRECLKRQRDVADYSKGVTLGAVVLILVAATVGLNGYPLAGIVIAVADVGAAAFVSMRLARRARGDAAGDEQP